MTLDAVTFGEVMAMFVATEPGPLERVTTFTRALAGAETNVATGLARLGHRTGWIGRIGDDPFGRFALAELAAAGIDVSTVSIDADAPTGFQLKSYADGGDPEVVYFRRNSAGSRLAPSAALDAYIAGARHLHLTGIPLALSATTRAFAFRAVDVARAAGLTVSFDPNLRPSLWSSTEDMVAVTNEMAGRADWVLPGLGEGAAAHRSGRRGRNRGLLPGPRGQPGRDQGRFGGLLVLHGGWPGRPTGVPRPGRGHGRRRRRVRGRADQRPPGRPLGGGDRWSGRPRSEPWPSPAPVTRTGCRTAPASSASSRTLSALTPVGVGMGGL